MTCAACTDRPRAVLRTPSAAIQDSRTAIDTDQRRTRATTEPSESGGPKFIWRSIRFATCWPCMSRRLTPRTGIRSVNWPKPCRPSPMSKSNSLTYVDQGYTAKTPAVAARAQGGGLEVIKLPEAKCGFVLLHLRWVVERSIAWMARFRRLARDYERLPETFAGLYYIAFACAFSSQRCTQHRT